MYLYSVGADLSNLCPYRRMTKGPILIDPCCLEFRNETFVFKQAANNYRKYLLKFKIRFKKIKDASKNSRYTTKTGIRRKNSHIGESELHIFGGTSDT